MAGHLGALASMIDNKICCLKDALAEYRNIRNVIDGVAEEKERLEHEERFKQEKDKLKLEEERLQRQRHANGEALEAMKEDILASKNTLIDARDAIAVSTEKIPQQNKELEVLKGKLQESQAKNNQVEQQSGSVTVPVQPRRVQTRSMDKRKRPSEEPLDYGAYESEFTAQLEGQSLSHVAMENHNEIVDVDDEKLQELKTAWGEGAHDAVVRALMQTQEYNRLGDRSIAYELWNYMEGRKATVRECVEYMCSQVKQHSATKRRRTRRMTGIA